MSVRSHRASHAGIKLKDVAAAAGVSIATVSRALRQPDGIDGSTTSRVHRVAAELGYVRYGPAAALSSMRSALVGVRTVAGAGRLDEAVAAECERELVASGQVPVSHRGGRESPRRLLEVGVGAVVAIGSLSEAEQALFASRKVRVVELGAVELDFDRAAEALAGFLNDAGHRRIDLASDGGRPGSLELAWSEALRARCDRLSVEVSPFQPGLPVDVDEAIRALGQWLERRDRATAVVCTNDLMAACVLRACAYASVAVPARLSVVGIGDAAVARLTLPALTTVRLPLRHAAASAVAACGGSPGHEVDAWSSRADRARLIVRGSTGPAR